MIEKASTMRKRFRADQELFPIKAVMEMASSGVCKATARKVPKPNKPKLLPP